MTKKQTLKRERTAAWRVHERLVAFLERIVAPGSDVRHNVFLPVIAGPQRKPRQCDVVIIAGAPPRQTLTIVEVQKRGRKVDISHFHGWLGKMQEVGANQLICVSERGFPDSVVLAAAQRGSQVKLLTLDSSNAAFRPPVILANRLIRSGGEFDITGVSDMKFERQLSVPDDVEVSIRTDEKIFSVHDADELFSLNDLVAMAIKASNELQFAPHVPLPLEVPIHMDLVSTSECAVWLHRDGFKLKIHECRVRAKVRPTREILPMMGLTNVPYVEHGAGAPLAWVSNVSAQGTHVDRWARP